MRKKIYKLSVRVLLVTTCMISVFSCKDYLDVVPEDAIDYKNMYQNIYDADAAVIGVYGKLLNVAKQYEVLNELRADLMDVTGNADIYLKQINTHSVTVDNPYTNPRPFYEVILNCNDVLKNLKIMYNSKKINESDYNQRYSDIGALRSWLYFQLGIHFGEIPYVTSTIENINDLKDAAKFPKIALENLVDTLINYTEALPYKDPYPEGSSLVMQMDNYPSKLFFVNKNCLLGDLYLWDNNYHQAATHYKKVLETTTPLGEAAGDPYYMKYVGSDGDVDETKPGVWQTFFSRSPQDNEYQWEWIWTLVFDKNFKPQNPFIELFSNSGGKYLVKPSQMAINNWNNQEQTDGTPFDLRGPDNSYKIINGQPVIMKFLYNYLNATTGIPGNLLEKNGKWFLYRASLLHLRYAEAANRENHDKVAYAFINQGIKTTYNYNSNTTDVTQKQATFLEFPYDLDGRKIDAPRIRGKFHRNMGIRSRLNIRPSVIDSARFFDMSNPDYYNRSVTDRPGLTLYMEDKIIDEAALELAYEGNRWEDLLRIALRRGATDPNYLADKIAAKFEAAGDGASAALVRSRLANKANWYLPFKLK